VAAIMSERAKNSGVDGDAMPLITLTVINVHASHVADARLYLRRETEIAEAAGAKIVVKVGVHLTTHAKRPNNIFKR